MPGSIILVGGGARSGKSRFALSLAEALGDKPVFVATAQAFDQEMAERIARHRTERPTTFRTLEEPFALSEVLCSLKETDVVLVDCLTLWLSNLLLRNDDEESIDSAVDGFLEAIRPRRFHTVLVTNEVGMGIVPESRLGRIFRDVAGRCHQRIAEQADEVYFAVLGTILRISPPPIEQAFTPRRPSSK